MMVSSNAWIEEEFKSINFGDSRLGKRFFNIFKALMDRAQSNISSAFNKWSDIKGCYRFFDNDKVNTKMLLNEHIQNTIIRINDSNTPVLIVHDTTYVDYKNRPKTTGLD